MSELTKIELPKELQPSISNAALAKIDEIATSVQTLSGAHHVLRSLVIAKAIGHLRKMLTDEIMADIMALQGNPLGFRTDKDSDKGYPVNVVKDCLIEAALRGARFCGNEVNIISARSYLTKEFYTRALDEMPGLLYTPRLGVPSMAQGGALVPVVIEYTHNGVSGVLERLQTEQMDNRVPVRVNSGMGTDAILGKAQRKVYKQLYELLTGQRTPDGEADDAMEITATPTTQLTPKTPKGRTAQLEAKHAQPSPEIPEDNAWSEAAADIVHAISCVRTKADATRVRKDIDTHRTLLAAGEFQALNEALEKRREELFGIS